MGFMGQVLPDCRSSCWLSTQTRWCPMMAAGSPYWKNWRNWTERRTDGQTDGRTEGQNDRWTDGRTDGASFGKVIDIYDSVFCTNGFVMGLSNFVNDNYPLFSPVLLIQFPRLSKGFRRRRRRDRLCFGRRLIGFPSRTHLSFKY